ncbi:MAG: hypothetical protein ACO24C_06390, partial [Candidatus Methylopumilus sp.]
KYMKKGKIFNAQEVQAILKGNKTMFRQVIKKPRHKTLQDCIYKGQLKAKGFQVYFENPKARWLSPDMPTGITIKCPYQVGQKIFVKEIWAIGSRPDPWGGYQGIEYKADKTMIDKGDALPCYGIDFDEVPTDVCLDDFSSSWQNAKTMPQWASRIILQIKEIRVEKLQDISEEDAIAEGIPLSVKTNCWCWVVDFEW